MTNREIQQTILTFLDIVKKKDLTQDEIIKSLEIQLDRLTVAYHCTHYSFDEKEYPEPPEQDYDLLRQEIESCFIELSLYNVPKDISVKVGDTELQIGDAVDDLVDIIRDLIDVMWYWLNTSEDNAMWHFQNGYDLHWGDHLRKLQLYLHERKKGY